MKAQTEIDIHISMNISAALLGLIRKGWHKSLGRVGGGAVHHACWQNSCWPHAFLMYTFHCHYKVNTSFNHVPAKVKTLVILQVVSKFVFRNISHGVYTCAPAGRVGGTFSRAVPRATLIKAPGASNEL